MDSLMAFVEDNLTPSCSAANIGLCDEGQKATLKKYLAMTAAERRQIVDGVEKSIADLEAKFEADAGKLQARYVEVQQEKQDIIESVNTKELALLKTIR